MKGAKWRFNEEWEEKIRKIVRDEMNKWDWIELIKREREMHASIRKKPDNERTA